MAGGLFYYTVFGRQVSNGNMAVATILAYTCLGLYFANREKKFEPIDNQIRTLDSEEQSFVKEYMEKHRPLPGSQNHHH